MCQFLFDDILKITAFKSFFRTGKRVDPNFAYEVAFGFMPREFQDDPIDRYIMEEEGDVTEIYFIMNGQWAIAFDSFVKGDRPDQRTPHEDEDDMRCPADMTKRGIVVGIKKENFGYIGDYYVLASKRSQFFYVALTTCSTFALSKRFLFKYLFTKYPTMHSEMLAESFSRYVRDFRKPAGRRRAEIIRKLNRKKQYSQIGA